MHGMGIVRLPLKLSIPLESLTSVVVMGLYTWTPENYSRRFYHVIRGLPDSFKTGDRALFWTKVPLPEINEILVLGLCHNC